MDLHQLVLDYGYLALFIGTFLEGESILLFAGFLAFKGYLDLPWVILSAFLGTFAGDQTFFYLGKYKGIAWLEKFISAIEKFLKRIPLFKNLHMSSNWHAKIEKVFDMLKRHKIKVIMGYRFLYGIRNVTPFVIGASRMHPLTFFALNFVAALSWALSFGFIGFYFGTVAQALMEKFESYAIYILGGVVLMVIGFLVWHSRKSKSE